MDVKLTQKIVKDNHDAVIAFGYCEIQSLVHLMGVERMGYTRGTYGWNADVYSVRYKGKKIALVTGNRSFGTGIDHQSVRDFEKRAEALVRELRGDHTRSAKAKALVTAFLDFVSTYA